MIDNVEQYLNIPLIEPQKIPIKTIIEQLNPGAQDKKLLESHVASVYLISLLNEQTIRVRHYKDDHYSFYAIYVLKVKLKKPDSISDVVRMLHNTFPESTLLLIDDGKVNYISGASKRINKNDNTKTVVEDIVISKVESNSLEYLSFKQFKAINLKEFNEELTDVIYKIRVLNATGIYPQNQLDYISLIREYDELSQQINYLKEQYNSASMMSEKAKIDDELFNKEKELQQLINKLGG